MMLTAQPSIVCNLGKFCNTRSRQMLYFSSPSKNGFKGFFSIDRFFSPLKRSYPSSRKIVKSAKSFLLAEKVSSNVKTGKSLNEENLFSSMTNVTRLTKGWKSIPFESSLQDTSRCLMLGPFPTCSSLICLSPLPTRFSMNSPIYYKVGIQLSQLNKQHNLPDQYHLHDGDVTVLQQCDKTQSSKYSSQEHNQMTPRRFFRKWRKLPFHKQFMWSFILTFMLSFTLLNLTLYLQATKAWSPSMALVSDFIQQNTRFAIKQYARDAGQLQFSVMDAANTWMRIVRSSILRLPSSLLIQNYTAPPSSIQSKADFSQAAIYMTNPNSTVLDPNMYPQVRKVLGATLLEGRSIKRFNVILYNNKDLDDIMIITIPSDPDFHISNITQVKSRMNLVSDKYFSNFPTYNDSFSKSKPKGVLFAQRSLLRFENYTILFDMQYYPGGSAKWLKANFFNSNISSHIIRFSAQNNWMRVLSQSGPLDPQLNYYALTQPGSHKLTLPNGTVVYAQSVAMAINYDFGKFHYPGGEDLPNYRARLIVHTTGHLDGLSLSFDSLIRSIINKIGIFLLVQTFALSMILLPIIIIIEIYLKSIHQNLSLTIQQFSSNPYQHKKFDKLQESRVYWAAHVNLMRCTRKIISTIISRIKRNKNKKQLYEMDKIPFNLFCSSFQQRHNFRDRQILNQIRGRIIKAQNPHIFQQKDRGKRGVAFDELCESEESELFDSSSQYQI